MIFKGLNMAGKESGAPAGRRKTPAADSKKIILNRKMVLSVVTVALVLVSFFPLAGFFSSDGFTGNLQRNLDKKNAVAITAFTAATAASVAVSLLPGDIGNAISGKLADMAGFFMLVTGAVMLEKVILALSGYAVFKIIIPLSLLIFFFYVWTFKKSLFSMSLKCFAFGAAVMVAVPLSLTASNLVEAKFYADDISREIAETERCAAEIDGAVREIGGESERRKWYDIPGKIADGIKNLASKIGQTAKAALESGQTALRDLAGALTRMVITVCVIPLLTVTGFGMFVKAIFGINTAGLAAKFARKIGAAA
jgi:hypothetical protein